MRRGEGRPVTAIAVTKGTTATSETTYNNGDEVQQGDIISDTDYNLLKNFQSGFIIHGTSPTEVSTLYVSNESDINDLSTEKIITVIYLYEYEESDESGLNVTPVSERHILNIHINFKSGVPEIGDIPLYWYQNNYWIAYYAQTKLGKTYSKSVPLSVANYHDLKKVMDDKMHHYYIDHQDVKREPKIYINDYSRRSCDNAERS